jgi:hypothetical protein
MAMAAQFIPPDLTGVIDRARKEYGWNDADEADAQKWYVAFLNLVWKNPGGASYVVTENADRLWHTHMTFSVRYTNYCMAVFGFYLNHTPIPNPAPLTLAEQQACAAAYATIGVTLTKTDINSITPCY